MNTQPRFAIERLAFIARALRKNRRVNCTSLAVDLEVSTKTIRRDMEFLRDRLRYDIEFHHADLSWKLLHAPAPVL